MLKKMEDNNPKPEWQKLLDSFEYELPSYVFEGDEDCTIADELQGLYNELSEWEYEGKKRNFFNLSRKELEALNLDWEEHPELTLYLGQIELYKSYGLKDYEAKHEYLKKD